MSTYGNIGRLRDFVIACGDLVATERDEKTLLAKGSLLLSALVGHDDWLPPEYAEPDPSRYRQYLLHCDSRELFSVVSFVWGPGQATPIHDHGVWGLVGMLRGAELGEPWRRGADGRLVPAGPATRLDPGQVEAVSPSIGDIHRVMNALSDEVSISIHVYGANIGRVQRSTYTENGEARPFISGYSNAACPNIWSY